MVPVSPVLAQPFLPAIYDTEKKSFFYDTDGLKIPNTSYNPTLVFTLHCGVNKTQLKTCYLDDIVTACHHGSPWPGFSCADAPVRCRRRRRRWGRYGSDPCSDSAPQMSQALLQTGHGLVAAVKGCHCSRCLSQCWGSPASLPAESFPGYSGLQIHASSYNARTIFNIWSFTVVTVCIVYKNLVTNKAILII